MPDINYKSFIAPDDNGKTVDLGDIALPEGTNWASAIKISGGVIGLKVTAGSVQGGHDAVTDINNRASAIVVEIDTAIPTGQFVATIKGGAHDVNFKVKNIYSHGKVTDIMVDDWSDQSHDATKAILLNVKMADGSPVNVIALKTKPSLAPGSGPYKFPWWQPINQRIPFTTNYYVVGFAFDTLRRWGFFRSSSNSP
jgi:hypothetical protein